MENNTLFKLEENIKKREEYDKPVTNWFLFILLILLTCGIYGFYIFKKRIDRVVEYSKRKYDFFALIINYLNEKADNNMTIKCNNLLPANSNIDEDNMDDGAINKSLHDFFMLISDYIKDKMNNVELNAHKLLFKFYYEIYKKNEENYGILRLIYLLCILFFLIIWVWIIPFLLYILVPELFHSIVDAFLTIIVYVQATILVVAIITSIYGIYAFYLYASQMSKAWDDIQAIESEMYSFISNVLIKENIIKEPLEYKPYYYNIKSKAYFLINLLTLGIWGLVWDYKVHIMPERLYKNLHNAEDEVLKALKQFENKENI